MFRNNIKIAIRSFLKQKGYSFINLTGLAIGLAACMFILLWVQDELSYDKFHEKADRIYIIGLDAKLGNQDVKVGSTPPPMAFAITEEFEGVRQATRYDGNGQTIVKYEDKIFNEEDFFFADSTFFKIFTFPMVAGDPSTALDRPFTVVITREMREKYFGDEDPIGKILRINGEEDFEITGICENPPHHSLIRFDFLASYNTRGQPQDYEWGSNNVQTFVLLEEGVSPDMINDQFPNLLEKYFGPIINAVMNITLQEFYEGGNRYYYYLEPLTDLHLRSSFTERFEGSTDTIYVYILSVIALFILLIACINFINLTTARSSIRAREVGIKKVVGSSRKKLIQQFLTESMIMSILSMIIAVIIVESLLPQFNNLAEKELEVGYLTNPVIIPSLIGLTLFVGFIAGSYSAFFQSSVNILSVLKSKFTHTMKSGVLRNILVVFQFSISVFLIVCTLVVFSQIKYVRNMDLGFDKDRILVVERFNAVGDQQQTFKEELLRDPLLDRVSVSYNVPGRGFSGNGILKEGGKDSEVHILSRWWADYDLLETLGLIMVDGRYYSEQFSTDSNAIIINQTSINSLELEDPLNQRLIEPSDTNFFRPIIGIVKDFNFQSAHNPIRPMSLELLRRGMTGQYLLIRVQAGNMQKCLLTIRNLWNKMVVDQPFEYFFLGEEFDEAYGSERRLGSIYTIFATLAIFIACLGLFGMASYTTEQKTKDIGIRKAMGATARRIVLLLVRDFNKWVLLANVFAIPVAIWLMKNWLENFAFRINIGIWRFVFAALITLIIAIITVSYQSVRAAVKNPADSLRYE
jgi:putative ABC transport system permease protein